MGPWYAWRGGVFPIDWEVEFGSAGPLHFEIGFGDGRYTVRRAAASPSERFVGVERSGASLYRAIKRVRRAGLDNIRLLAGSAEFAVRHLFARGVLETITVNFPDPWPKERHRRNRLLKRSFFDLAATRLRQGGRILLATDHKDYLEGAVAEARSSDLFRVIELGPPPAVFETKYALKWRSHGKPLHYRAFEYHGGAEELSYPILERPQIMPHALLTGVLTDRTPFEKQVLPFADGHVIVHEAAQTLNDGGGRWLFRVTIDEPDLKQQLLVAVQQRSAGELIVRLESFGDPIVTPTARGAIHAVTEWLLNQLPDLKVRARNY